MEEKENMFNKLSIYMNKKVKELYNNVFDIMTDITSSHEELVEKENSIITFISTRNTMGLDLLTEKTYEFLMKNRGKAMIHGENEIEIINVDFDDRIQIEEVFVNLYKYILFTKCYLQRNCEGYYSINPLEPEKPDYTFENIDAFIQQIISIYKTSESNGNKDLNSAEFYLEALINEFAPDYPQYNKLYFYVEAFCDLINQSRHYPELFGEKTSGIINSKYSQEFVKYIFIIRDYLESRPNRLVELNKIRHSIKH